MEFGLLIIIKKYLLAGLFGGAFNTYKRWQDGRINGSRTLISALINLVASAIVGSYSAYVFVEEFGHEHLGFGVAILAASIGSNIIFALVGLDWDKIVSERVIKLMERFK